MPRTKVLFFREDSGEVPTLKWLDGLPLKARVKCIERIERLRELGHELRRPEADYLRDEIYELRVSLQGINHRVLYFFHGKALAVLSHGIVKEREVPPKEISRAIERKIKFKSNPKQYSYEEIGK